MVTHSSILARKFHGQRSLRGYIHGGKESDTSEQLSKHACVKMLENTCAGVVTRDSR